MASGAGTGAGAGADRPKEARAKRVMNSAEKSIVNVYVDVDEWLGSYE